MFYTATRKILAVCLLLSLILTGCASDKSDVSADDQEKVVTVGFSQLGAESDWRLASTLSIESAFEKEPEIHLIMDNAQQKQENQLKAVREFIDQSVDYIILDPITETGWDATLAEAKEAGIPVIIVDREVDVNDPGLYTMWIGTDFELEGNRACEWLNTYLKDKDITKKAGKKEAALPDTEDSDAAEPEEASEDTPDSEQETLEPEPEPEPVRELGIIHIQGTIGSSAQIGRSKALVNAAGRYGWRILDKKDGDFVYSKAKYIMEQEIKTYGDNIDVVYCENDDEAYGVIEALKEAGYTPGLDIEAGEVLVMSFDATRQGLNYTYSGMIAVDTECTPLYGEILVDTIKRLEAGEKPEKKIYLPEQQFSSINNILTTTVNGIDYDVIPLSQELIDKRTY